MAPGCRSCRWTCRAAARRPGGPGSRAARWRQHPLGQAGVSTCGRCRRDPDAVDRTPGRRGDIVQRCPTGHRPDLPRAPYLAQNGAFPGRRNPLDEHQRGKRLPDLAFPLGSLWEAPLRRYGGPGRSGRWPVGQRCTMSPRRPGCPVDRIPGARRHRPQRRPRPGPAGAAASERLGTGQPGRPGAAPAVQPATSAFLVPIDSEPLLRAPGSDAFTQVASRSGIAWCSPTRGTTRRVEANPDRGVPPNPL